MISAEPLMGAGEIKVAAIWRGIESHVAKILRGVYYEEAATIANGVADLRNWKTCSSIAYCGQE
jgi:hypothetical protein